MSAQSASATPKPPMFYNPIKWAADAKQETLEEANAHYFYKKQVNAEKLQRWMTPVFGPWCPILVASYGGLIACTNLWLNADQSLKMKPQNERRVALGLEPHPVPNIPMSNRARGLFWGCVGYSLAYSALGKHIDYCDAGHRNWTYVHQHPDTYVSDATKKARAFIETSLKYPAIYELKTVTGYSSMDIDNNKCTRRYGWGRVGVDDDGYF